MFREIVAPWLRETLVPVFWVLAFGAFLGAVVMTNALTSR
ncbi:Uncharacterised protein [Mycobacteroides abscessus subsp. massiliense]|uniref:Uncharacterized protein n=1 Tax=Mycobacteroides abscessus subsp. massiliense TaxID=1962118 RepID=A0A1U3T3Q4_9MYCO|nr:Uncharacterised protein [Mycobacteroides abscessus subsp. massiliense]SKS92609.1 Uncharacterised protein [Mycobacteroides abscessus subsp. massiliense]SKT19506.1 Uncharacterised protein [Mycobacteroides abscessus subsp. massiliense]SKW82004.1 Uncharacterised protein [Mycobacteroides abscessus subsp. massiliense]SLC06326.1 Uncharacterised protein [Mycobacteroides abscessus subsp. massiliense]